MCRTLIKLLYAHKEREVANEYEVGNKHIIIIRISTAKVGYQAYKVYGAVIYND